MELCKKNEVEYHYNNNKDKFFIYRFKLHRGTQTLDSTQCFDAGEEKGGLK